jgi:hypothetical protein
LLQPIISLHLHSTYSLKCTTVPCGSRPALYVKIQQPDLIYSTTKNSKPIGNFHIQQSKANSSIRNGIVVLAFFLRGHCSTSLCDQSENFQLFVLQNIVFDMKIHPTTLGIYNLGRDKCRSIALASSA